MKKLLLIFLLTFTMISGFASADANSFISVWNTTDLTLLLPLQLSGTYDFTVDWGDGTTGVVNESTSVNATHTYVSAGTYNVTIDGVLDGWNFGPISGNAVSKDEIIDITQWGNMKLGNDGSYFYFSSNLNITAIDAPDLSETTILSQMFSGCAIFNGNINHWNTSSVTDMRSMFSNAYDFNQPLNNWNTSSVTDMQGMFYNAYDFNQPLNNWNTSSVTDMQSMFYNAYDFNQPLNNWNISSVTDMQYMFYGATSFNGNINDWDTSSVTVMNSMFDGAISFNQPLNNWNTSSVINYNFNFMFQNAISFNQPLDNWDVSGIYEIYRMFNGAIAFDQNIGMWIISGIGGGESTLDDLFLNTALSTWNYNQLLNGWAALPTVPSSIVFGGGNSQYYGAEAIASRAYLTGTKGWIITDGGETATPPTPQYPSGINFSVDGNQIDYTSGDLSTTKTMPSYVDELNTYLDGCTPDAQGYCDVPLTFETVDAGNLFVDGVSITYGAGGGMSAIVSNVGLSDTELNTIWATANDGSTCVFTPSYTELEVGDFFRISNSTCGITCNNFLSFKATTTCGTNSEFIGTPVGC